MKFLNKAGGGSKIKKVKIKKNPHLYAANLPGFQIFYISAKHTHCFSKITTYLRLFKLVLETLQQSELSEAAHTI